MFYAAYCKSRALLMFSRRYIFFVVRTIFQRTDNMRQDDAGSEGRRIVEFRLLDPADFVKIGFWLKTIKKMVAKDADYF